jgi:exoribonuclease-2
MHVLYELSGDFKLAKIFSETDGSLQLESANGKRFKVKDKDVLLRFVCDDDFFFMPQAKSLADTIDLDLIWECAPQDEFHFTDLANEYFGAKPTSQQLAALLLRIHSSPIYFYRKGRGVYKPAPPETLKAALAAVERKRQENARVQLMVDDIKKGTLPDSLKSQARMLLFKPDKNTLEYKAWEKAVNESGQAPERLMLKLGGMRSAYELHMQRFVTEYFPRGTHFNDVQQAITIPADLPQIDASELQAFSIDDISTTEIDDAFSVQWLDADTLRIGIHIAVPALAMHFDDECAFNTIARNRLSTVYMPGDKITMLPDEIIEPFTLAEQRYVPALSLYLTVDAHTSAVTHHDTQLNRIWVARNLRHNHLDELVTEALLDQDDATQQTTPPLFEFQRELSALWRLMKVLSAERDVVRGKPEGGGFVDFNFAINSNDGNQDEQRVDITRRRRDAPLDRIVAELMICVNSTWGLMLADHGVPGIYRTQQNGKAKMQTAPAIHQGLGVMQYAWSSSPLRRYVDMVNQWQLLSVLRGTAPIFSPTSAALFSIIGDFDATYSAYNDFQDRMEKYWSMRWLQQQAKTVVRAQWIKEDLVRMLEFPMVTRVAGLPNDLQVGDELWVDVLEMDEVTLHIGLRFREKIVLSQPI